ncbi:MAG: hypothetical protein CSYNP_00590 [Syntrophus sp. SKADARSKE-3]|nr:hypothetical protein [Syntrophus sp. SKADARSKE-3]
MAMPCLGNIVINNFYSRGYVKIGTLPVFMGNTESVPILPKQKTAPFMMEKGAVLQCVMR